MPHDLQTSKKSCTFASDFWGEIQKWQRTRPFAALPSVEVWKISTCGRMSQKMFCLCILMPIVYARHKCKYIHLRGALFLVYFHEGIQSLTLCKQKSSPRFLVV